MEDDTRKMPWPHRGQKPFLPGESPYTNCDLKWLSILSSGEALMAEGFKLAADRVVESLESGSDRRHPDQYFYPVAYLYRHFLELEMKCVYTDAMRLLREKPDRSLLTSHNLYQLWDSTRAVLERLFPEEPKGTLADTGRIIEQFHALDKTGQAFRYSTDTKGRPHLKKAPRMVDLANLRNVVACLAAFFDGVDGALGALYDARHMM